VKITLAINIFNKEKWIESLLDSWVSHLSGKNDCEIIVVFDACRDRSEEIAGAYLSRQPYEYKFFHADDKFEIYCHNLALENATGDYIVFIQDDNWIYDKDWDALLEQVLRRVDNVGVIGFLAGLDFVKATPWLCKTKLRKVPEAAEYLLSRRPTNKFLSGMSRRIHDASRGLNAFNYDRVEIARPHKGDNFPRNLKTYELGVWRVDAICRPFCISRELIVAQGGLDKAFMPTCGDDLDLSIKLLKEGKTNLYIPYDLLNIAYYKDIPGKNKTVSPEFAHQTISHAWTLCRSRHVAYFESRRSKPLARIIPLGLSPEGNLIMES
jgi:glycosyltransferase involved in cell wall biosynthesis